MLRAYGQDVTHEVAVEHTRSEVRVGATVIKSLTVQTVRSEHKYDDWDFASWNMDAVAQGEEELRAHTRLEVTVAGVYSKYGAVHTLNVLHTAPEEPDEGI